MSDIELLNRLYERFNARDIPAVLAALHDDVAWANGMDGGHVNGHDAVRHYWTQQWEMIDPHVQPKSFTTRADGIIEVDVQQRIRNLNGDVLSDKIVRHIFRIENGVITRFDIG